MTWDREKYRRFVRAYLLAKQRRHGVFTFEGNEFDIHYAYYLIEYLSQIMVKGKSK